MVFGRVFVLVDEHIGGGGRAKNSLEGSSVLTIHDFHDCHCGFFVGVVLKECVEFVENYSLKAGYFEFS